MYNIIYIDYTRYRARHSNLWLLQEREIRQYNIIPRLRKRGIDSE